MLTGPGGVHWPGEATHALQGKNSLMDYSAPWKYSTYAIVNFFFPPKVVFAYICLYNQKRAQSYSVLLHCVSPPVRGVKNVHARGGIIE